jgi:hypothetical protein
MRKNKDNYEEEYNIDLSNIINDNDVNFDDSLTTFNNHDNDNSELLNDLDNDKRKKRKLVVKKDNENKGKLLGKHSLHTDTIFKSSFIKKDEDEEEYSSLTGDNNFDIDPTSNSFSTDSDSEEYGRLKFLKEKINSYLVNETDFDLSNNRKKPTKEKFNEVFSILIKNFSEDGYSNTEIFVEYAPYFSEDLYAMFKMLDKKYSLVILKNIMKQYNYKNIEGVDFI